MNIKEIIKENGNYIYIITSANKTILLSSSNSKNEAKEFALKKLQPNIKNLIGKKIYLITLKNISKKDLKNQEENTIKLLGGPLMIEIEKVLIINENKLKNEGGVGNNKIYFSEKYLKEKSVSHEIIKKITSDYHNEKLKNGPLDVNIIQ